MQIDGNGTVATINGPIWVTEDFSVTNSATVKLSDSLDSNGTVIVVDGEINVANSAKILPNNPVPPNTPAYLLITTTCIELGIWCGIGTSITVANNNDALAIFHAPTGKMLMSNSAKVAGVAAKRLDMTNSSQIIYDPWLTTAKFAGGPSNIWQVRKGSYYQTTPP